VTGDIFIRRKHTNFVIISPRADFLWGDILVRQRPCNCTELDMTDNGVRLWVDTIDWCHRFTETETDSWRQRGGMKMGKKDTQMLLLLLVVALATSRTTALNASSPVQSY